MLFVCSQAESKDFDYKNWWENWYLNGKISGEGSRGDLARFKADTINNFLRKNRVQTVVEFGCGDGINLSLINYPYYLGLDISRTIIQKCIQTFKNDHKKNFKLYEPDSFLNNWETVDLVVCLDVLYHVTDEKDYVKLLDDIFSYSAPHVILYTTLYDDGVPHDSPEIKHRNVMDYLKKYGQYTSTIVNQKYPDQSKAEFIFLSKN